MCNIINKIKKPIIIMILYTKVRLELKKDITMKKILVSCMLFATAMSMASIEDFKAQLTTVQDQLKAYQSEIDLYNQSLPKINIAKQDISTADTTIANMNSKITLLSGIENKNGVIYYNNNAGSNDVLTKANQDLTAKNTILDTEIASLTSANAALDTNIVTARATLGTLRSKPVTSDITANITFYQGKIAEYLKTQADNTTKINAAQAAKTANNNIITTNTNTMTSNTAQIATYQAQIDAATKMKNDSQKIIDDWSAKLNATPDKISAHNFYLLNRKMSEMQTQIDYLNNQISILQAKAAAPAA